MPAIGNGVGHMVSDGCRVVAAALCQVGRQESLNHLNKLCVRFLFPMISRFSRFVDNSVVTCAAAADLPSSVGSPAGGLGAVPLFFLYL